MLETKEIKQTHKKTNAIGVQRIVWERTIRVWRGDGIDDPWRIIDSALHSKYRCSLSLRYCNDSGVLPHSFPGEIQDQTLKTSNHEIK